MRWLVEAVKSVNLPGSSSLLAYLGLDLFPDNQNMTGSAVADTEGKAMPHSFPCQSTTLVHA
jgi:hypothetical protein